MADGNGSGEDHVDQQQNLWDQPSTSSNRGRSTDRNTARSRTRPTDINSVQALVSSALTAVRNVREGRQQLPADESDSDDSDFAGVRSILQSTRRQFHRRRVQDTTEQRKRDTRRRRGRARAMVWKAKVFLLKRGNADFFPPKAECRFLINSGFGYPTTLDNDGLVEIRRIWTLQQLEDKIISIYPNHPLGRIGFRIACCKKNKFLTFVDHTTVAEIEKTVRRGQLVIVPNRDLQPPTTLNRPDPDLQLPPQTRHQPQPQLQIQDQREPQPQHQPEGINEEMETDQFVGLSDFESDDESSMEQSDSTPTIIIQPNRRAFNNFESLLQNDEVEMTLHRENIMKEMLETYEDSSIVNKRLKVNFLEEEGEDVGGLTREALTSFWNKAHHTYFAGENVCVPFVENHRRRKERDNIVCLGRILSHTALLTRTVPSFISKSSFVSIIFDSEVDETCLLEDLLQYVTGAERRLLKKSLNSFQDLSQAEMESLTNLFTAYDFHDIPKQSEIRAQLLGIADLVFVQRPGALHRLIRQGIPEEHVLMFWSQLSIEDISAILLQQKPSSRRVASIIKAAEEDLTNNQDRVLYFIKQYVVSLGPDELQDFLQFCTGSIHMPDEIKISFNVNTGLLRRPIAHTCSNVLELSEHYSTYQDFRREMRSYLSNPHSFTFSAL